MPSITDKFGKASIDTNYALATTVKTARTVGESVLACYDLSRFSTTTPVYFVTYKKTTNPTTGEVSVTNQTSWKAIVNPGNNTFTNLTLAPGYTDIGNDIGDFVECIPTSYWGNELVAGIEVHANPDGTLKNNSVGTSQLADKSVTLPKINGGTTAGVLTTDASGNVAVGSKTTDANGWTVINHGSYKEYMKQFTGTGVAPAANSSASLVNAASLPVGMSNLTGAQLCYSFGLQYSYAFSVVQEGYGAATPGGSTALNFLCWNGGSGAANTGNWYINVSIIK